MPGPESLIDRSGRPDRIGLVLGAGGGAGGMWIRGVLEGLATTTGFRPEQSAVLVGTSIGAIKASGIGPPATPPPGTAAALSGLQATLAPSALTPVFAPLRRIGGAVVAALSREGEADPLTWVEHIEPSTRARVVSAQRFPPARRVVSIADSPDAVSEVAASAAIPFGARRVVLDGRQHVDGAVWSVTNADLAPPDQLDALIVIAPLVTLDGGSIVTMSGRHQLASELRPWRRAGKPALVFAPTAAQYQHRQDRPRHREDGLATALAAAGSTRR